MEKIQQAFQQYTEKVSVFMMGRNGYDALAYTLFFLYVPLSVIAILFDSTFFTVIASVPLCLSFFRATSKNIQARRKENDYFTKKFRKVFLWINQEKAVLQDKNHSYFRCPQCKHRLRVPKGKGTLKITCSSCQNQFIKKS